MAPSPLNLNPLTIASDLAGLSPMAIRDVHLAKRAPYKINPAQGTKPPQSFNNVAVQITFAFIGLGMTLGALWFFFWAKNGGFKWRENDWEDYKSTVLRRKGPDGKTLSNATKSTRLGGGSVVHGGSYGAESSVGYTDETGTSADMSEMREAEEGKGRRAFGIRGGDGRHDAKKDKLNRPKHDNNYRDPELREYRQERPARVGGINREADGMYSDYASQPSELGSNVSSRPLVKGKEKEKPKDKKQEAKDKERRAKERMRKAKLAEKEALKTAAAAAKAQKEAEKAAAKKEKEEKKKAKKTRRTESEATPSEAPDVTEYTPAMTEYTAAMTEYTAPSEAGGPRRGPPSAAYSFVTGDDQTVYTGVYTDTPSQTQTRSAPSEVIPESSYYSDYRPNGSASASRTRRDSRTRESRTRPSGSRPSSQSPRKQLRSSRTSATPSDIFTAANGDVQGTISYPCHIPGLSSAGSVGVSESVSQVGGPSSSRRQQRDVVAGYRRGGVRTVRRDSLSDSDA